MLDFKSTGIKNTANNLLSYHLENLNLCTIAGSFDWVVILDKEFLLDAVLALPQVLLATASCQESEIPVSS